MKQGDLHGDRDGVHVPDSESFGTDRYEEPVMQESDPSSTVGVVILGEFGRKSLFFNEWVLCRDGNVVPQLFRIS